MSLEHAILHALRASVILGLGLAAMPLLRRAPAATRRLVLALALGGALLLPAVSALAPAWHVTAGPAGTALRGRPFAEPLSDGHPTAAAATVPAVTATGPAAHARAALPLDPAPVLGGIWALGALAVALRLAAGWARARAIVRRASPAPAWARAVARAEHATGLRAEVRLTDEMDAPAVAGVISPVVLVPLASAAWSDERRFAVLLHELAHVRQGDCFAQIVAQLACALHWFDPLAWIAARRLRLERELAADDAVLAAGARASTYAEDLLAIAGARPAPSGALGMAEPSQLAARIRAIVSTAPVRAPLTRPRAAALVATTAVLLGAVACARPGPPAPASSLAPAPPPAASGGASTIDPRLQQIADEELDRTVAEWKAAAGVLLVLDPATGEVLANAGRVQGARSDVAVRRAYVTGSTLKLITLAAALEEGVVTPIDRFDCENGSRAYGARTLHDSQPYGLLSVPEMLAVSTNVGFSKVFDRVGGDRLERWLRRFHFGAAPAVDGAVSGELVGPIADRSYEGATVAIGETMTASPLQMAAAYAAVANGGQYLAPTLSRRSGAPPREAILRPETARSLITLLEEAVNNERTTAKAARISGTRVAGKTGTAAWALPGGGEGAYASFIGIVPADRPRFVILVGVEGPREGGYGGTAAAPAFARVASRALQAL